MGMFAFKAFLLYHYSRSQYHVCSLYFFDYFCSSYLPFARPDLLVWIALNVNTYLDYVTDTCLKIGLTVGNIDSLSLVQKLTHLIAQNFKYFYGTWLWLGILHNKLEYDLALTLQQSDIFRSSLEEGYKRFYWTWQLPNQNLTDLQLKTRLCSFPV